MATAMAMTMAMAMAMATTTTVQYILTTTRPVRLPPPNPPSVSCSHSSHSKSDTPLRSGCLWGRGSLVDPERFQAGPVSDHRESLSPSVPRAHSFSPQLVFLKPTPRRSFPPTRPLTPHSLRLHNHPRTPPPVSKPIHPTSPLAHVRRATHHAHRCLTALQKGLLAPLRSSSIPFPSSFRAFISLCLLSLLCPTPATYQGTFFLPPSLITSPAPTAWRSLYDHR